MTFAGVKIHAKHARVGIEINTMCELMDPSIAPSMPWVIFASGTKIEPRQDLAHYWT
jgi:hypothetical protein